MNFIFFVAVLSAYPLNPIFTDNTPCLGAGSKEDLCLTVSLGECVIASNDFPFGTRINIPNVGICRVADRMNSRYSFKKTGKYYIDVAFPADEIKEAQDFGRKTLRVGRVK